VGSEDEGIGIDTHIGRTTNVIVLQLQHFTRPQLNLLYKQK